MMLVLRQGPKFQTSLEEAIPQGWVSTQEREAVEAFSSLTWLKSGGLWHGASTPLL